MRWWRCSMVLAMVGGAAGTARSDDDGDLRGRAEALLRADRRGEFEDLFDLELRHASQANQPVRLGHLELLYANIQADHPTDKSVLRAHTAVLHLGSDPEAPAALVRYHVSGAQVTLAAGRHGAAAYHVQEGRTALANLPAGDEAARRRDESRLGETERSLLAALHKTIEEAKGGVGSLSPGTVAALSAYATGKPLVLPKDSPADEPVSPASRPPLDGLKARLDHALSEAEAKEIAADDGRHDDVAAAAARARHAETLLRMGRRDDAIKVRREAREIQRKRGAIEAVVVEGRWIAERFDKDHKAQLAARRDVVDDIEKFSVAVTGPARAALQLKFHRDYVALVEAAAPLAGKEGKGSAVEALVAVERVRDRSIWDEAQVLGDAGRWKRLGAGAADLRRVLETAAKDAGRPDESEAAGAAGPTVAARQRATDGLTRMDSPLPPAPLDDKALFARLGGRPLVIYGRLDPHRLAIAALSKSGAVKVVLSSLSQVDEVALVQALRAGLAAGDDSWRDPARKLHDALIGAVAATLTGDRLVIVPDGAIAAVPFAVLLDAGGKLYGATHAVSFAPSLTALARPPVAKIADRAALVLGIKRFAIPGVAALPSAEREASAVKTTLEAGGKPGDQPAEKKIRALSPGITPAQLLAEVGPFDVVHLALRSRPAGDAPLLGALALAANPLYLFDLAGAALRTNLLVVDAPPQPAPGPMAAARSLAGIAAAALVAPARDVVMAQSSLDGPSTAALLTRFYERYTAGEAPAVALAGAQRDMAGKKLDQPLLNAAGADPLADGERFAHPRFWAPFVLWGEP